MTDKTTAPTLLLVQATIADTLKVEGRDGDHVGAVYAAMIHKSSGQVTYAVLSLGGFLGMGKSFYPVPFSLLTYDPVRDVYVVTIDKRVLEGGPSWSNNAPTFDQAYADRVSSYYGVGRMDVAND